MHTKRDATPEEARKGLQTHAWRWDASNPNHRVEMSSWEAKEQEAIAEGYKAEVCSCGVTFCAFHQWTTCRQDDCPFSTGRTMLDYMG